MKILGKGLAVLAMFLAGTSLAHAGAWTAGTASTAAGTQVVIPISFAGDGVTISSQVFVDVAAPLSIVSAAGANGQSCTMNSSTNVGVVLFSFSALPNPATVYCNVTIAVAGGAAAGNYPVTLSGQLCSVSGGGAAPTCTAANGQVTVTGGGMATGPSIAYNPAAGASAGTGGPVNFTGVTTPGTTGNGSIVATPSGGAAAGTTTVGSFVLSGAAAANFAVTSAATLTFTAGTNTPQNITMTCTSTAAAQTANLQATETITNGATTQRFWVLNCPAGAAAAVPPTLTYAPATGSTTNVASAGNFDVAVGCPTDGAACNGSGTGLAATSRLVSVTAVYTGPPFSPTPTMACNFVNEAGGNVAAPLDFVATQADAGDVRCACPVAFTAEPFTVTVVEQSPAGGASVNRSFNVVCGAGLTCGTISATPGTGTVNLNNGGAPVTVTTVNFTGATAGQTQQVSCTQSGVSAGSTFTVTGVPATLSSATTSTTVAASCSNTATTAGTATLTCTSTANSPGCTTLNATYTLTCPGVNVPPPVNTVPVPAMSEQGRILLAALVLLLGLGVVGFRMRG
jgi:hypothetical protein